MSSSAAAALASKTTNTPKSVNTSSQPSPAHSQASAFFASEGLNQRRSGGSGAAAGPKAATPRNNQTTKSKHKQSKRFRLADEDAFAESVRMLSALAQVAGV